jgi:hypothetical protein
MQLAPLHRGVLRRAAREAGVRRASVRRARGARRGGWGATVFITAGSSIYIVISSLTSYAGCPPRAGADREPEFSVNCVERELRRLLS